MIVGIDEVGRGCWAGPLLVVAAYSLTELPLGLADSKILSKKQRIDLIAMIVASCKLGEGWVGPEEIDNLGLTAAMRLAVERALIDLEVETNTQIIMDGNFNYCPKEYLNVSCMIKADVLEPIVSAASIYAKVTRDQYMVEQAVKFPGYSFDKHVGYGTAVHADALKRLGVCNIHRLSYKPVKVFIA